MNTNNENNNPVLIPEICLELRPYNDTKATEILFQMLGMNKDVVFVTDNFIVTNVNTNVSIKHRETGEVVKLTEMNAFLIALICQEVEYQCYPFTFNNFEFIEFYVRTHYTLFILALDEVKRGKTLFTINDRLDETLRRYLKFNYNTTNVDGYLYVTSYNIKVDDIEQNINN